jgi:hypothetical protein
MGSSNHTKLPLALLELSSWKPNTTNKVYTKHFQDDYLDIRAWCLHRRSLASLRPCVGYLKRGLAKMD